MLYSLRHYRVDVTLETCKEMIKDMFYRMELPFPDNKIEIYSDSNDEYTSTLKDFYCETCITYGQLIKIKKSGRLVEKIKVKVFGGPSPRDIETTDIEKSLCQC